MRHQTVVVDRGGRQPRDLHADGNGISAVVGGNHHIGGQVEVGAAGPVLNPGSGDIAVRIHRAAQDRAVGPAGGGGQGHDRRGRRRNFTNPLVTRIDEVNHPGWVNGDSGGNVDQGVSGRPIPVTTAPATIWRANQNRCLVRGVDRPNDIITKTVGDMDFPGGASRDAIDPGCRRRQGRGGSVRGSPVDSGGTAQINVAGSIRRHVGINAVGEDGNHPRRRDPADFVIRTKEVSVAGRV